MDCETFRSNVAHNISRMIVEGVEIAVRRQIDLMPEIAAQDWVRRFGQPRNRTQFIVRIALHAIRYFHLPGRQALRFAGQTYCDFERDARTRFGDPAFAWDDAAAGVLALEYGADQ